MLLERTRNTAAKELASMLVKAMHGPLLIEVCDHLVTAEDPEVFSEAESEWAELLVRHIVELRPDVLPDNR